MWLRRERYDFYLLKILLLSRKDTTIRSQVIGLQSYLTCLRFYLTCLEIYPAYSFFYPINQRSHAESIPKSEGHPAQTECPSSSTNTVFNVIITIYETILKRLTHPNGFRNIFPEATFIIQFFALIYIDIWSFSCNE